MTSQKLSLTSEITVSVRIPAGLRPFFLKFKNFTATVRHLATSPLKLFSTWSNLSIKQSDTSFNKDNIWRNLQPWNIRVTQKPITTLRQLLTNAKDTDEPRNRQGVVYKINCSNYHASYIGETGRNLTTRLTAHKRTTRKGNVTITLLNITDLQITLLSGTQCNA